MTIESRQNARTVQRIVLIAAATLLCASCGEQRKTVRAFSPEMNNMEMLSMTQQPDWQILAGTQWLGTTYINTIKGTNEKLNAGFFWDGNRNYTQARTGRSGTMEEPFSHPTATCSGRWTSCTTKTVSYRNFSKCKC
ncbi:MAG: hypothetical protein LBB65_09205 [Burkholderiales bacterium]|nr:hypothetical protein [Burkholderiales bacterium]